MVIALCSSSNALSGAPLCSHARDAHRPTQTATQAFFGRKRKEEPSSKGSQSKAGKPKGKAAPPQKRKQSFLEALDFSDARSYEDAKLLSEAKYGKRENGRMSKEQYNALRRKVGGTSKDFFKEWVDVQGAYTDKGYVGKSSALEGGVPGLWFLVGVVVAMFATTSYVVTQF